MAYYVPTAPDHKFLSVFIKKLCLERGVEIPPATPDGIEITRRYKDGQIITFVLNHNNSRIEMEAPGTAVLIGNKVEQGRLSLDPFDVAIFSSNDSFDTV